MYDGRFAHERFWSFEKSPQYNIKFQVRLKQQKSTSLM